MESEKASITEAPKLLDLGMMNEWPHDGIPEEFTRCVEAGHRRATERLGRCYSRYTCPICRITYTVDSSD